MLERTPLTPSFTLSSLPFVSFFLLLFPSALFLFLCPPLPVFDNSHRILFFPFPPLLLRLSHCSVQLSNLSLRRLLSLSDRRPLSPPPQTTHGNTRGTKLQSSQYPICRLVPRCFSAQPSDESSPARYKGDPKR